MKTVSQKMKNVDRTTRQVVPLYVLSDSTGNLARHMVTSFLTQFPAGAFEVVTKPFVNEPERFSVCLAAIAGRPGIVFHAVVAPKLKQQIAKRCAELNAPCCDLTGPAVEFLANAARLQPHSDSQRLHPVDAAYCGRINAMSYTLEHDDGLGLEGLAEADVVLVGVSRTGKTPTSILLAMQGYRAANVSLASGVEAPNRLFALNPRKIMGLVIDPTQLAQIRTRRQTAWRMTPTKYNDPHEVAGEIDWSRQVFAKLRCPVLDVTDQAIEETAARIVDMLGLTDPAATGQGQELQ